MNREAFTRALEKLSDYFEIQSKDMKAFLKMAHSSFFDLKHPKNNINIENLEQYFSIYNDATMNIALSKSMPLMQCIYYNLVYTGSLIKKLAEDQSDPKNRENLLAKLEHFEIVMDFFHPSLRDFHCKEDEIYSRICDARKAIKLIWEKDNSEELKKTLDKASTVLDSLEKSVIKNRIDIDNFSKYDVADKLAKLIKVLPNREERTEIETIFKELDIKGSLRISKANSCEDEGTNKKKENFNLVLDEFFDPDYYDADIADDLQPKIESYYTPQDLNDKQEKEIGKMPIFFIFRNTQTYLKTYIDEKIWEKTKTSKEFKNAVYTQYEKIRDFVLAKYGKVCTQDNNFDEKTKEMWVKNYEEMESWNCTMSSIKKQDIADNVNEKLSKDKIAQKVRKTINENMKNNYTSLYVFRT